MAVGLTLDGPVRATVAKPTPPRPRGKGTKRPGYVIPTVPKVRAGSTVKRAPAKTFKPPTVKPPAKPPPSPSPAKAAPAAPAVPTTLAGTPFPTYGDPVLDSRRRALASISDTAIAAAQADASKSAENLGMLAQLAGMGQVQTQGTTLPPAVAALPGVLTQDAQRGMLTRNALAVDSGNRLPTYLRSQALANLAKFDADVRDAQLKARADQLNFLKGLYQQAILSGNAQMADATRRAIADQEAQTAQAVAETRSAAQVKAAEVRAAASGKTGGKAATKAGTPATLMNQWSKAAGKYDPTTRTFNASSGPSAGIDMNPDSPNYGRSLPGANVPGEKPRQFFDRAVTAGVKPRDAIKIVSSAGAVLNERMIYVWLLSHMPAKQARLLTLQITGSDPIAREG